MRIVKMQQEPIEILREKAFGFITARSIYAVAKLGIADLIKDGARTAEELADKTGGNAHALYRIMRTLSGEGIFHEDDDGRFALTPIGLSLPFIPSAAETLEFRTATGYPFRHA